MIRFDGYSATTLHARPPEVVDLIRAVAGPGEFHRIREGKGFHQFGHRLGVISETGTEWAAVQWGGGQGDRVMFEVKGEGTPGAVDAFRERYEHRCTRVDSCADFDAPGAFDSLLGACLEVKQAHGLKGERQGDWEDFPELGRTLYLGSRQSVSRVRLYEKGKQPEYRHLDRPEWTRIEIQVRPSKDAKTEFSALSPSQVWGASSWTRDLAGKVLQQHVDPHPAGTVYRRTETEAAFEHMCRQYGPTLLALLEDLGDWQSVGLTIGEKLQELAAARRSRH